MAVTNEDRVRLHRHIREGAGKQPGVSPMCGGTSTAEQAGLSQDERPGTNRRQSRVLAGTVFSASTSAGSIGRPSSSSPPATSTVSADSIDAMRSVTAKPVPIEVLTSRPSTEAILSWYSAPNRLASANTSPAQPHPTTSRHRRRRSPPPAAGRVADTHPLCRILCETWPIGQSPVDRPPPQTGIQTVPHRRSIP